MGQRLIDPETVVREFQEEAVKRVAPFEKTRSKERSSSSEVAFD